MDDARYWMWEKQRGVHGLTMRGSSHNLNTDAHATPHSSYDPSWEEKAFAEDAAGTLGGCLWPPRSYSCNFCGREFRSAQALGGHMNVHRRDRARLKQSLISPQDVFDQHQLSQQLQHVSQSQKPFIASRVPSQVCDLAYNLNPNPASFEIPAPSLTLKLSSPSATGYISIDHEPTLVQLGLREPKQPWSKNLVASDLKMDAEKRCPQILKCLGEGTSMHCDKPDISVSLNLFLFQTQARKQSKNEAFEEYDDGGGGDSNTGSKRRKLTADESSTMSSSYTKSNIVVDHILDVQQKLFPAQRSSSFVHDLDLELRLGEQPKVI